MKHLRPCFFLLLFIQNVTLAQNASRRFVPAWQEGEKRQVLISEKVESVENGKKSLDTSFIKSFDVLIAKEEQDEFIVEMILDNTLFLDAFSLENSIKLPERKATTVRYSIQKKDGSHALLNAEEVREKIKGDIDEILQKIVEEDENASLGLVSMTLIPVKEMIEDDELLESMLKEAIGFFFVPFDKEFKMNEAIKTVESTTNPFSQSKDTLSAIIYYTLSSYDENSGSAEIKYHTEMDLKQFRDAMHDLMVGMMKSFGAKEEEIKEVEKELSEMVFEFDRKSTMIYSDETFWPIEVSETTQIKSVMKDMNMESVSTKTIILQQ